MALLKLEIFETAESAAKEANPADGSALEDVRLAAYEQGYSAGWEDASAAQSSEQSRIRSDLARNIQALGFTFHEARLHMLKALAPLMQGIVCQLLPEVARTALAPTVLQTLMPLTEQIADAPVSLVLNPMARAPVEALLEQATSLPIKIVEEPSLSEGQAYLRLGDCETHIDLDRATADLTAAIRGFFGLPE